MNSPNLKILALFILLLATSCAAPGEREPQLTNIPVYTDPCAETKALALAIDRAAAAQFGIADSGESPARLTELGGEAAQELAESLQPAGSICEIPVSPDTRALIDEARSLAAGGNSAGALRLLDQRLQQIKTAVRTGRLAKIRHEEGDWRNKVRDILAMGAAAYDLGGDPQPYHAAAEAIFRANAGMELAEADLLNTLRIENEAGLLGDEEIEEQARRRANEIAGEMIEAALEDFNPCNADREAVVNLLNAAARAAMLGVEGLEPGEVHYEEVKLKSQQALAHQWNAYVRQRKLSETLLEPVPPCNPSGELEVRVFSICSQSWAPAGRIQFKGGESESIGELRGEGHLSYSEQSVIGGELDCSINIDANVLLTGTFLEEDGIRRVRFTPSFSSDGKYMVVGRTTPIRDEGVYPFNGYGAFIMPWVNGSVHPDSGKTIIQYVLHITPE